jgi:hypothetical protein
MWQGLLMPSEIGLSSHLILARGLNSLSVTKYGALLTYLVISRGTLLLINLSYRMDLRLNYRVDDMRERKFKLFVSKGAPPHFIEAR